MISYLFCQTIKSIFNFFEKYIIYLIIGRTLPFCFFWYFYFQSILLSKINIREKKKKHLKDDKKKLEQDKNHLKEEKKHVKKEEKKRWWQTKKTIPFYNFFQTNLDNK